MDSKKAAKIIFATLAKRKRKQTIEWCPKDGSGTAGPQQIHMHERHSLILKILTEKKQKSNHLVVAFGRMNPITTGHQAVVNKVKEVAKNVGGEPAIYLSKTHDKKKNPLDYPTKVTLARKAFGDVIKDEPHRHLVDVLKHHTGKYDNVTIVAGSDRLPSYQKITRDYNGKEFHYKNINFVSSGLRDPDSEGIAGISGTKMRDAALHGNYNVFKSGLPPKLQSSGKSIFKTIRKNVDPSLQ